ncbi:hypothetical protein [Microlunatus sp. GCM10028923]|uniref:hypothetical protein n=1 Tax=Microlunatus sp. GCM10028923 TaxID=3273400 RepID=UPI003618585C
MDGELDLDQLGAEHRAGATVEELSRRWGRSAGAIRHTLEVRASFPWLAQLPSHLLARLDWAEIQVPTGVVADVVRQLEAATGQLVMIYHRDHRGPAGTVQLCQLIEVAQLSPADATVLVDLERTVPDVSIVLYGNPLRLR